MIPVHRPQLPVTGLILPYLKEIDHARWYSNFGPLLVRFEHRLAEHFGVAPEMLATASNGTLMLISILKALDIPENSFCVMPSWTFVATPAAACHAGLIPYFVDVDRNSQTIEPEVLKQQLNSIQQDIGAVMVIAPFGAPINRTSWDMFTRETGIPVIIDAAAAFDTVKESSQMSIGKTPMMISLHATKVLGIGEGGLVLSSDGELIGKIKRHTNFGFNSNRESLLLGYNAKLSEFSAAVGLAALDNWHQTRQGWADVRDSYIENLEKKGIHHGLSKEWVSSTYNVNLPNQADKVAIILREKGIDTRKWWGNGCHKHPAYQLFPIFDSLSNTNWLSQSILGLPCALDLEEKVIKYICDILEKSLDQCENNLALGMHLLKEAT